MRSGRSTWRPLFRTIERSWPSRTLPHRSSPPLQAIQWVGQVRNEPHLDLASCSFHSISSARFLSVHPIVASSLLCIFLASFSRLSHLFSCPFLRVSLSSSTPVCPLYLLHPPPPSLSPLYFHAYAHWWISNNGSGSSRYLTDFKRSAFSTSSSPTHATL